MKNRVLYLVFALVLISSLTLVACGTNTSTSSQPSSAPTTAPSKAPTTTPAASSAAPAKVIELKFAYYLAPTSFMAVNYLHPFAQRIEAACQGKVKVTEYAAETLSKEAETVTAIETGIADIGLQTVSSIPGRFPLFEVTGLPFMGVTSGKDDNGKPISAGKANSIIAWELYQSVPEIQQQFSSVKVLYTQATEDSYLLTTKKAVANLADLKGLKIRSTAGLQTDQVKALGAVPTPLALGELYQSAQSGVIDGAIVNSGQIINSRLYELLKYKTDVNMGISIGFAVIMNKDKFASLPPDVQQGIMSVSGRAGAEFAGESAFGPGLKQALDDAMVKGNFKWDLISVSPEEQAKWKAVGQPLWDGWVAKMNAKGLPGQKVLDEYLRLQKKYGG